MLRTQLCGPELPWLHPFLVKNLLLQRQFFLVEQSRQCSGSDIILACTSQRHVKSKSRRWRTKVNRQNSAPRLEGLLWALLSVLGQNDPNFRTGTPSCWSSTDSPGRDRIRWFLWGLLAYTLLQTDWEWPDRRSDLRKGLSYLSDTSSWWANYFWPGGGRKIYFCSWCSIVLYHS